MVSSIKLPILNKGEYILWTIKMEQYLDHTNYALWEVILNGQEKKDKNTLLMAIPDEHLARFHGMKDAKTLWAAIKNRFGAWSNISLIMRNKPGINNLDIDDLYNNLKVYEVNIKGSSGSSSNSQNVAFVSAGSTSSTNELNASYSVSTATGYSSQAQEQIDQDDLEKTDLKCQVAMLSMRVKRFYKKTRRNLEFNGKEPIGFDKINVECFSCHRRGNFARDCRSSRNSGNRIKDARNAGYRGRDNGYDSHVNEKEVLVVKEKEVHKTEFNNRSSDEENSLANDRFKKGEGYHAVPSPLTRNYMPPKFDLSFAGLDDSIYKFKISETVTSLTKDKKDAPETSTTCVENPKEDSMSHLIKDCTFHEDKMAKKSVLPNNMGKGTGHNKGRLVWNNVQRINHQNKFAPTALFTRSGRIPVSTARLKVTTSTSAPKLVNTARPKQSVKILKSRSTFHKSHSPIRRSFYNAIAHSRRNSTERVNTAGSKAVSAVKGNGVTIVKTSAGSSTISFKEQRTS
nr:hypothetical protein [Tanacetum cinerariifolium]